MRLEPGEARNNVSFLPSAHQPRPQELEVSWEYKQLFGIEAVRLEKCILQKNGMRNTFYLVKIFKFKFGFAISGEVHEHF